MGGASLRSPLAFRGAAAVDAAGLHEHRTNNSTTKEQLLLGGASLRSPLAFRGAAAVDPAAAMPMTARPKAGPTKDNTTAAQKSSFFGVGLRCARRWPSGVLLRWMLLLPGYSNTGPTTAAQQKSSFFGVGLRCARRWPSGVLLRWILLLLLGYSNTGPFAGLLEQRTFAGLLEQRTFAGLLEQRTFAGLLPLLVRPLPFSPPPSPRLAVNHNARLWLLKNVYYVNK